MINFLEEADHANEQARDKYQSTMAKNGGDQKWLRKQGKSFFNSSKGLSRVRDKVFF
jgi:hypothetical protein